MTLSPDFTLNTALMGTLGGALIGISASLLLLFLGRVAGISSIIGNIIRSSVQSRSGILGSLVSDENTIRIAFLIGLVTAGTLSTLFFPNLIVTPKGISNGLLLVAGIVVGIGVKMSGGCTSGHGVCGISRFSLRSIVATLSFMFSGALSVGILYSFLG